MAVSLRRSLTQNSGKGANKTIVPVKFSSLGTPYVDSSVSAISPQKLAELVQEQMRLRDQGKNKK